MKTLEEIKKEFYKSYAIRYSEHPKEAENWRSLPFQVWQWITDNFVPKSIISQTKQELIEEVKKMRKCQYNSNKPEYKMTKRFITELLQKLSNK